MTKYLRKFAALHEAITEKRVAQKTCISTQLWSS